MLGGPRQAPRPTARAAERERFRRSRAPAPGSPPPLSRRGFGARRTGPHLGTPPPSRRDQEPGHARGLAAGAGRVRALCSLVCVGMCGRLHTVETVGQSKLN